MAYDSGNVSWPDDVDAVLAGDQALMLGTVTPAKGVVLMPVTNFAVRDRNKGTITAVNSSIGVSKKLERMRRDPHVALAYHTRRHCFGEPTSEYVLIQGLATLSDPDPRYVEQIWDNFQRYAGGNPRGGPLWDRWLAGWHHRVGVTVDVKRVIVWPDLTCRGEPATYGLAPPTRAVAPQTPPKKGTGPRLDPRKAARAARRQPDALLGWTDGDGFPMVVPVTIDGADDSGILLTPPPGTVPPDGRRAGFTAHWYGKFLIGQNQKIHTGWMESDGTSVIYSPHTKAGYFLPPSKLAYKLGAGGATLRGRRQARKAGVLEPGWSKGPG